MRRLRLITFLIFLLIFSCSDVGKNKYEEMSKSIENGNYKSAFLLFREIPKSSFTI
jgi:hypothetical protein